VRLTTCPTTTTSAPRDRVWQLLTEPRRYPEWADAELVSAEPADRIEPGARVLLRTRALARSFDVVFDVHSVDPAGGTVVMDVHLPFGIVNHETITVRDLSEGQMRRISFG
jgi:hypothetical protein